MFSFLFGNNTNKSATMAKTYKNDFKETHSFKNRKLEGIRVIKKYPDAIPVVIRVPVSSDLETPNKDKFIVPDDITIAQFIHVVRRSLNLNSMNSLCIKVGSVTPRLDDTIQSLYNLYMDEDKFLYLDVSLIK